MIVAGEASGDLHGATLAAALRAAEPRARCFGVGGDRMAAAGVEILYHMRHLAVVGFAEVLWHLRDVRRALNMLTEAASTQRVDAVVLLDYPDFNLTLARRLRRAVPEVPIVYYISPQIWAWRGGRVRSISRLVDTMLVILPFEEELYSSAGVEVEFVGHPLLDVVESTSDREEFAAHHGIPGEAIWIGLLPGSRRVEVERLLPHMLGAAEILDSEGECAFLVPLSASVDRDVYQSMFESLRHDVAAHVYPISDDYYATLKHCELAAVCSGTATLEAALMDTPGVVVYRTSWLTYNLAKSLVHVRDMALVNLIAGRRVVPELLQHEVTAERIASELRSFLHEDERRQEVRTALAEVRESLGSAGASQRAAQAVLRRARGEGSPSTHRSPAESPSHSRTEAS
jgi:lipid-A-disaccharide synthase